MALATTCPACSTSFKVNPEQLKLRRGLVRCGMCEHVFSGVEYLRYVSDSQSDEDLNPPNEGGDRRRSGRRSTDVEEDLDQSTTDELKTAFFLPDTELPPDFADDTEASPAPPARPGKQPASELEVQAAAASETLENAASETADPAATPTDEATDGDKPKKLRKGGPRGRRGRGRRKKAAQAQARRLEQEKEAESDAGTDSQAPKDTNESPDPDTGSTPLATPTEAPAPTTLSTPVVTAPLTQGSRLDSNARSGRNDSWQSAPVWPRIDEHFDEPDIEEPDSIPGPATLDPASPPDGSASPTQPLHGEASTPVQRVATGQALTSEEDAIDFFGQTSKPSFDFDLPPRKVLVIAAALIAALVIQIGIGNRDVLAARFPAISPVLQAISSPFGLTVELPMQIDSIKIASFDLVAASEREPDADYVMNLLMRNKAANKVRWPALELTLLDNAGGILARKVFQASDYVADPGKVSQGLAANSEQPFRIGLKSTTTAPVGYSVSLLYP